MASSINSGSPFTQASQSAKALGSFFSEVTVLTATLTTGGTTATVAHGLTATPDFVVATVNQGISLGAERESVCWTATGNTISLITASTLAATRPINLIAGVLG